MNRRNILLIHSDQHRYDCLGSSGIRPCIKTPNLDQLAAEGTRFTHAFSTIPICTPARASLMTGSWPSQHGSLSIPSAESDHAARTDQPCLTKLVKSTGYQTAWIGKFHWELPEIPGPWCGIDAFVSSWDHHSYREQIGISPQSENHGLFGEVDSTCPPEHSSVAWQADHVIRVIESADPQKPLFIRWDPPEPHPPCRPVAAFHQPFETADIPPWNSFPDSLESKPHVQRRQQQIWGTRHWTWQDWLPIVRLYYAIIAELDHHIGRVLDALEASGRADDTLVIYSADHGDFCGGHGMMDKHFCMYDDVLRVPLILRNPGRIPAGGTCDSFASSNIDINRTVLSAAGAEIPKTCAGNDLSRMASDPAYQPRPVAYAQYFGTESGAWSCRMIREKRFKYVYHPTGDCDEFYDLKNDPGERLNRINDPTVQGEIARLKKQLFETMQQHGDRLANNWTAVELKGMPNYAQQFRMPTRQ